MPRIVLGRLKIIVSGFSKTDVFLRNCCLTFGHGQVERPLCSYVSPAQDIIYGVGGELGRTWLEHREAAGEGGGGEKEREGREREV